jgi:hypothetical protein
MGQYLFLVGELLFNIAHIEKVDEGELGRILIGTRGPKCGQHPTAALPFWPPWRGLPLLGVLATGVLTRPSRKGGVALFGGWRMRGRLLMYVIGSLTAFLMTLNSAVLARSSSVTLADGEELICTYRFSDSPKQIIIKYHREGDFLVETNGLTEYRILQNSPDGLIAVWSMAEVEPNRQAPSIGTFSVMLEKKTRRFMRFNAFIDEGTTGTAFGSCL